MSDSPATADLIDDHADILSVCTLQFHNLGGRPRFSGPIRTVRVLEDNGLVKRTLAAPGDGAVLVVDGGGSMRTALMGDLIAASAVANGWSGVVIAGCIRDSVAIATLDLGVKALGAIPVKSAKAGAGEVDVVLSLGDCAFTPGHWLYSDEDGIVVAPHALR